MIVYLARDRGSGGTLAFPSEGKGDRVSGG